VICPPIVENLQISGSSQMCQCLLLQFEVIVMAEGPPKRSLNSKAKKLWISTTKRELPSKQEKLKITAKRPSEKQKLITKPVLHFNTQQKVEVDTKLFYPKTCPTKAEYCIGKKEETIATTETNVKASKIS